MYAGMDIVVSILCLCNILSYDKRSNVEDHEVNNWFMVASVRRHGYCCFCFMFVQHSDPNFFQGGKIDTIIGAYDILQLKLQAPIENNKGFFQKHILTPLKRTWRNFSEQYPFKY